MPARKVCFGVAIIFCATVCSAVGNAQRRLPALQADIETTYEMANGLVTKTKGRLYRDDDGSIREDTQQGATIMNMRTGAITLLQTARKEAVVMLLTKRPEEPSRLEAEKLAPYEHSVVGGYSVSKVRAQSDAQTTEIWTAEELGLILYSRVESSRLKITKVVGNIVKGAPDPSVFRVPSEYRIVESSIPPSVIAGGELPALRPAAGEK